MPPVRVAIIGDYDSKYISHPQTGTSVVAAGRRASVDADFEWIGTGVIANAGPRTLDAFDGVWMSPGSPYRSLDGALIGIRHARLSRKPFVGT